MSYEDIITIKAFLMALESLDRPLPEKLQIELGSIATTLPESAYELHDLAECYEPLNQRYLKALQNFPGEGERLKFVPSEGKLANGHESETDLTEVETLIGQLRHQIAPTSTQLDEVQLAENVGESTVSEPSYVGVRIVDRETVTMQPIQQASLVKNSIQELGWTEEQIAVARYIFKPFQEDWDDPAMEVYDDL